MMAPLLLNCTATVADVRLLRALAFATSILGITFLLFAVPMSYITGNRAEAIQFLAVSLVSLATTFLLRRGSVVVACLLAAFVALLAGAALLDLLTYSRAGGF